MRTVSEAKKVSRERPPLDISEYEPTSMLHVHESRVERSRFPAIDFHTHISFSAKSEKGIELAPEREYLGTPQECLSVMDRKNLRAMVNLTGGYAHGLADAVASMIALFPDVSIPSLNLHTRASRNRIIRNFRRRPSSERITMELAA